MVQEPKRLGDFEIVREIGRGGMGVVYEAIQLSLNRPVALKVLPPGATPEQRDIDRFQREARAAALLDHPNIVPIYAQGEHHGAYYYAMQYIDGRSLDRVVAGTKGSDFSAATMAKRLAVAAASGLCPLLVSARRNLRPLDTTSVLRAFAR